MQDEGCPGWSCYHPYQCGQSVLWIKLNLRQQNWPPSVDNYGIHLLFKKKKKIKTRPPKIASVSWRISSRFIPHNTSSVQSSKASPSWASDKHIQPMHFIHQNPELSLTFQDIPTASFLNHFSPLRIAVALLFFFFPPGSFLVETRSSQLIYAPIPPWAPAGRGCCGSSWHLPLQQRELQSLGLLSNSRREAQQPTSRASKHHGQQPQKHNFKNRVRAVCWEKTPKGTRGAP